MTTLVTELSIILVTTAALCTFAEISKQPLIPAYILAGLILGEQGFQVIQSNEFFLAISKIGIILLLYLIGLELKPHHIIRTFSRTSLIVLITIIGNLLFGGLIYYFTNTPLLETIYFSIALFFSSTVVAMRTLQESKTPHQKVFEGCLGILLIQDIIAVVILIILNSLQVNDHFEFIGLIQFIFYGIGVIFLSWFLQKWLLRHVLRKILPRNDIVFLVGLAWCFLFAEIAEFLHLSREIGAFIAGLSVTSLPEHKQQVLVNKSETIRDFFMVLFFFMLGANFKLQALENYLPLVIVGLIFVIIIKPAIFYFSSKKMGFSEYQSQEIALRLGQISEFSIIVVSFGIHIKQIDQEFINVIQFLLFTTIVASGYFVRYAIPKFHKYTQQKAKTQETKKLCSK